MPRDYQPIGDTWRRYCVAVPEDDDMSRAEGRTYIEKRADELTAEELADLTPEERAEADADLAAMDAAAAIGADDERAWRDHEHGRDTDRPMAAE